MKEPKIVKVTWLDACDKDVSYETLKEIIENKDDSEYLCKSETIGELIKLSKNIIVIRHHKNEESSEGEDNELILIPRDWVTKIEYYKKVK